MGTRVYSNKPKTHERGSLKFRGVLSGTIKINENFTGVSLER
jgi:hypothetical protein